MRARFLLPAGLLALAACAAVPGYTPPPLAASTSKSKFGEALESGDVREGRYEMSAAEKAMDCRRLTGSMQITLSRLKDPYMRQEPSAVSATAQSWMGTKGADRDAAYARERAKLDAYNEELGAKGCKKLDIETELARAPDPPGKRY